MHQPNLFHNTPTGPTPAPTGARSPRRPCDEPRSGCPRLEEHRAAKHRQTVLEIIRAHPGRTGQELCALASAEQRAELEDVHELYRKAAELLHRKLVTQGGPRPCSVKGSMMVTWLPVETP